MATLPKMSWQVNSEELEKGRRRRIVLILVKKMISHEFKPLTINNSYRIILKSYGSLTAFFSSYEAPSFLHQRL